MDEKRCGHRIMLVEDEDSLRIPLKDYLDRRCDKVVAHGDGRSAILDLEREFFDVVITDIRLPEADGFEVMRKAKEVRPDTQVIMITAYGSVESAVRAMKEGAFDYITKPFSLEELGAILDKVCEFRTLTQENLELKSDLELQCHHTEIVANSKVMKNTLEIAKKVSEGDLSAMIVGETGVGKELLAEFIHYHGPRRGKRIVKINCAAIPDALFESEMFGHERGAFTGAIAQKRGRIEMASSGTLFLDEIQDLSATGQAKLLRAIEEKAFERVGGNHTIPCDFRPLCATQRDPKDLVREGKLREDLYFRLAVFTIFVPPLRERKEDILDLASIFLQRNAKRMRKEIYGLDEEATEALLCYPFPGNVRELRNLMEAAAVLCTGRYVTIDCLPEWVIGSRRKTENRRGLLTLQEAVSRFETEYIRDVLKKLGGRKEEAAKVLGISRKTLWQKLRRLDSSKMLHDSNYPE